MNYILKRILMIFIVLFSVLARGSDPAANSVVVQLVESQMVFDSTTVESAEIVPPHEDDQLYSIFVSLNAVGAQRFANMTNNNIGKTLNTIVNGHVFNAAVIRSKVGSKFMYSGFTKDQAKELLVSMNLDVNVK